MDRNKKIWLGISLTAVAVGGFFLAKYLTRNVVHLKYATVNLQKYDTPPVEKDLTD